MAEHAARSVYLDQASCSAGVKRPGLGPGTWLAAARRSGVVGHGGQQQRGLRPWAGRRNGREDGAQPRTHGAGASAATGGWRRGRRRSTWPARSAPWDYTRLIEQPAALPAPRGGRGCPSEPAGVADGSAPQMQLRETPVKAGRGTAPGAAPTRGPTESGVQAEARRRPARPASCGPATGRHRRPPGTGACSDRSDRKVRTADPGD